MSLRRYLDSGGDWTPIVDLPPHLVDLIAGSTPLQTTEEIDLREFQRKRQKPVYASITHSCLPSYMYNSNRREGI